MNKFHYTCFFLVWISALFSQKQDSLVEEEIFINYERSAEFPGGQDSLLAFIKNNLRWPDPEYCGEGTTVVAFEISTTGKIRNIKIVRSIGELTDLEVLKFVKLMPNWIPATFLGKPIVSQVHLPIRFKLK